MECLPERRPADISLDSRKAQLLGFVPGMMREELLKPDSVQKQGRLLPQFAFQQFLKYYYRS
ncbi:MAG: hypothetical protein JW913_01880 [Chitinispirillaceae bacterium]|nr:hypothetical protein [Chitinispirillaceae bacterium]